MKLYYYHDAASHKALNTAGDDYTPAYVPIMLKNAGYTCCELTENFFESAARDEGSVIILGADTLSDAACAELKKAISNGCTVIGFGTVAKGIFPSLDTAVSLGRYDIAGFFSIADGHPLPVIESFGNAVGCEGEVLGRITDGSGKVTDAFFRLSEKVYYFTFDLPATLWRCADGKPANPTSGRVPDCCLLDDGCDYSIAFADEYLQIISDIVTDAGIPRLYPLPQKDGKVADLLLFFAGDDDAHSAENDMKASDAMYARGLPYHLNIMPADHDCNFVIGPQEVAELQRRGHELAVHYDFTRFTYTPENHRVQTEAFTKALGVRNICPVNHCLVQRGSSADQYRMQADCGALGDNNLFQFRPDPEDINAFNLSGFGFGSAFPTFVIDDAKHGNSPINFCQVPCSYYEPRIYRDLPGEYTKISDYLDAGAQYGRSLQLFTHPHYISGVVTDATPALKALDYAMEYVMGKGWNTVLSAPDAVTLWWHARANSVIDGITKNGFTVNDRTEQGAVAVLPCGARNVRINGRSAQPTVKTVGGRELTLLVLNSKNCRVEFDR